MPVPRPSYPMYPEGWFEAEARASGCPPELAKSLGRWMARVMNQQAIDERLNYQWINDNISGGGGGVKGRAATFVVAAANAKDTSIAGADFVCDGTNDEVEIQSALDAASPWPGGRVLLTEGQFHLSDTVTVHEATMLEGHGINTTILLAESDFAGQVVVELDEPSNVTVSNLSIDAQSAYAEDCILLPQSVACVFENLQLAGAEFHGINFSRPGGSGDHLDATVRGCRFENLAPSGGGAGIVIEYPNRGHFHHNLFSLSGAYGIYVSLGGFGTQIHHNTILDPGFDGIELVDVGDFRVDGNWVYSASVGIDMTGCVNGQVIGNKCYDCVHGIKLSASCDDVFVIANDLFGFSSTAITDAGTGTVKINNRGDDI